jgi:hypothetical protein
MNHYCENCHLLNEQDYCQSCGKKNLKKPSKTDYCFLIEVDSMFGEMFKGILENENIPYVDFPSGNGVRSQFALKLENLKIFIAYEFFNDAKELLNNIPANFEEAQSRDLKNNINRLFVQNRAEKRIKKKFKMSENESLIAYCTEMIRSADSIDNRGRISGCTKGGEYLFAYKGNEFCIINSVTYEIISVEKINPN